MINPHFRRTAVLSLILLIWLLAATQAARADGMIVDRIYDPYVQPLEKELEYRPVVQADDELGDRQRHSFGFGRSFSDRWAAEIYAIGTRERGNSLNFDTYELEAKWQLTEQGEFAFDWGLVFEVERESSDRIWELSTILISSRDFGRWTGTANFGVFYESGGGIDDELETELHVQARYRLRQTLEPAVEIHLGQGTRAAGPALTGLRRISPGRKIRWELGVFFGLDEESPDQTFKAMLELEF